jgi:hypothetical protein
VLDHEPSVVDDARHLIRIVRFVVFRELDRDPIAADHRTTASMKIDSVSER